MKKMYNKSKTFLQENCHLIASGSNKLVYYNKKNDIVFKLYKNPFSIKGEIVKYQLLTKNKINFFVPKMKVVNNFVCIQQFANPILLQSNDALPYDFNNNIMDSKIIKLKKDPIRNTLWEKICNEITTTNGHTSIYNWGIRNNKILLVDIESIKHEKAVRFLKYQQVIDQFKETIRADQYYG